jgi:hypothetical protein
MVSILDRRQLVAGALWLSLLLSACAPGVIAPPSFTPASQLTLSSTAHISSPAPLCTPTARPPAVVLSSPPPSAFPTDTYPDPVKRSGTGATFFDWCPNPVGLQHAMGLPPEIAIALINSFHSGDTQTEKVVTDPAMWPVLDQYAYVADQIDPSWLDGTIQPASTSAYAAVLADQCGQQTIDHSWTARICPEPCSENTSASLIADYFFLNRGGVFLIWFLWP